jgi:hypothetical protein
MGERDMYNFLTLVVVVYIFTSHLILDRNPFMRGVHAACLWRGSQRCSESGCRCTVSFWSLSHIIYYAVLSAMCPSLRVEMFIIGIVWELLEIHWGYDDMLDIFWNALGILIGAWWTRH